MWQRPLMILAPNQIAHVDIAAAQRAAIISNLDHAASCKLSDPSPFSLVIKISVVVSLRRAPCRIISAAR
jgi:hypothetical protein